VWWWGELVFWHRCPWGWAGLCLLLRKTFLAAELSLKGKEQMGGGSRLDPWSLHSLGLQPGLRERGDDSRPPSAPWGGDTRADVWTPAHDPVRLLAQPGERGPCQGELLRLLTAMSVWMSYPVLLRPSHIHPLLTLAQSPLGSRALFQVAPAATLRIGPV
jgi:hypothetical protein